MKPQFTVLALTVLAGILICDSKATKLDNVFQHIFKSRPKTWTYQGKNATAKGKIGLTLMSHYVVAINENIKLKPKVFPDCTEIKRHTGSGLHSTVYTIKPQKTEYHVYCDMKTKGGGWTVIQRRFDGSVNFYRKWNDYKKGFGTPKGEYWLGNEALYELTNKGGYRLRVELTSLSNVTKYAEYETFAISSESKGYKLSIGGYSGTAGNSMASHNGYKFTTIDKDNDSYGANCAVRYKSAWWFLNCSYSNLNSLYPVGGKSQKRFGINWYHFGNTHDINFKETKMMIQKKYK